MFVVKTNKNYSKNSNKLFKFDKNHFTRVPVSDIMYVTKRIELPEKQGFKSGKGQMKYGTEKYDL